MTTQNRRLVYESQRENKKEALNLSQKLKSQNYHVSGCDHPMVYKSVKICSGKVSPRGGSNLRSKTPDKGHFRSSFQQSYDWKMIDRDSFRKDLNKIYERANKKSIPMQHNEENLKLLYELTKDVQKDDVDITYENTNLINHIPFADKKNPDVSA